MRNTLRSMLCLWISCSIALAQAPTATTPATPPGKDQVVQAEFTVAQLQAFVKALSDAEAYETALAAADMRFAALQLELAQVRDYLTAALATAQAQETARAKLESDMAEIIKLHQASVENYQEQIKIEKKKKFKAILIAAAVGLAAGVVVGCAVK